MIYLDNAATTYPKPESVLLALDKANRNAFNSGRGGYLVARKSTSVIDEVRKKLLEISNINSGKVILTPSATIALNTIIFGIDWKKGDNAYVSPFEHNSIMRALNNVKEEKGINVEILSFDKKTWTIDTDNIENHFALKKPKAIFVSHVSNVTGLILPYELIFELASKYDSINVLDSSQSYGVMPIESLKNINYIVFAGHKSLYASFGIAGFIKLKKDILRPLLYGGTGSDSLNMNMPEELPNKYESGSSNIVAISGLKASIEWLETVDIKKHEEELTKYLIEELSRIKKIKLFLPMDSNLVFGVVSFDIEGYNADEIGTILNDEFNICVRTGYHCAPLVHDFIGSSRYNGTVRISLSYFNTKQDIDELIKALNSL